MIRSRVSARFTSTEVEEFRQIGLDLCDVTHQDDIEREVRRWAYTFPNERTGKDRCGHGASQRSATSSQAHGRAFVRFSSVVSVGSHTTIARFAERDPLLVIAPRSRLITMVVAQHVRLASEALSFSRLIRLSASN
jgi:hypothetical protein